MARYVKIVKHFQIFTKQTLLRRSRRRLMKTAHGVCLAERSGSTIMLTCILGKISMSSQVDRIPSAASAALQITPDTRTSGNGILFSDPCYTSFANFR